MRTMPKKSFPERAADGSLLTVGGLWRREHRQNSGRDSNWNAIIPLFLICAAVIYFLLEVTLIPLLEASRWQVLFCGVSFLALYAMRHRLNLDLTDGMILSIFGIGPLLMASMLTINYYFSEPYDETYVITAVEFRGNNVELILEQDAYQEFFRIRNIHADELHRANSVTYHFGHGPLGWQVKRGISW